MRTFELVNPSDAVTFQGDDLKVAGVAILLLGNGKYSLEDERGDTVVPLMFFGGVESWLKEQRIRDLGDFVRANAEAIASFLETVAYCTVKERQAYDKAASMMAPAKAAEFLAWHADRNRSSENDIGKAAVRLAAQVRARNLPSRP